MDLAISAAIALGAFVGFFILMVLLSRVYDHFSGEAPQGEDPEEIKPEAFGEVLREVTGGPRLMALSDVHAGDTATITEAAAIIRVEVAPDKTVDVVPVEIVKALLEKEKAGKGAGSSPALLWMEKVVTPLAAAILAGAVAIGVAILQQDDASALDECVAAAELYDLADGAEDGDKAAYTSHCLSGRE